MYREYHWIVAPLRRHLAIEVSVRHADLRVTRRRIHHGNRIDDFPLNPTSVRICFSLGRNQSLEPKVLARD